MFTIKTKIAALDPVVNNAFDGALTLNAAAEGTITITSPYAFKLQYLTIGPHSQNFTYTISMLLNNVDPDDVSAIWGTLTTGTHAAALMFQHIPNEALMYRRAIRISITNAHGLAAPYYYNFYVEERSN